MLKLYERYLEDFENYAKASLTQVKHQEQRSSGFMSEMLLTDKNLLLYFLFQSNINFTIVNYY